MIDWNSIAREVRFDGRSFGSDGALNALAAILGRAELERMIDIVLSHEANWLLVEQVLRLVASDSVVEMVHARFKTAATPSEKQQVVGLLRQLPNPHSLHYFEIYLSDPSVEVHAAQLLEKQLWGSGIGDALEEHALKCISLAKQHSNPEVRQEAIAAERHLKPKGG